MNDQIGEDILVPQETANGAVCDIPGVPAFYSGRLGLLGFSQGAGIVFIWVWDGILGQRGQDILEVVPRVHLQPLMN